MRMNILIEGIDYSGKSNLARYLSENLNKSVWHSSGPEIYAGEMIARVTQFLALDNVIFDRHPCVGEPIYSQMRRQPSKVAPAWEQALYDQEPLIIYCDPLDRGLGDHKPKSENNNIDHANSLARNYRAVLSEYRYWALKRAHVWYRIGDDKRRILRIARMFDPWQDVKDFMGKFLQHYDGKPRMLPDDLLKFRMDFMVEEFTEYSDHVLAIKKEIYSTLLPNVDEANITHHLAEALDALIDLAYVVLGTAHLHGFDFVEGWRRVHDANMRKARAASSAESVRGSPYDVVKPPGWERPKHDDLVEDHIHRVEGSTGRAVE